MKTQNTRLLCLAVVSVCWLFVVPLDAQPEPTCPAVVQAALTATDNACRDTGRNEACYGNVTLTAQPQLYAPPLKFDQQGDKVNVVNLQSLQLSAYDSATKEWGVALMRLQANLPDSLPGQNVTLLLFGNVDIQNAVKTPIHYTVEVKANRANIRETPSTSSKVLKIVKKGTQLIADGRDVKRLWLRVRVGDGAGWIDNLLVTAGLEMFDLEVVEPGAPLYTPMQAIYLKTGIGDAPCADAPNSGLLVQTPKGAARVTLRVNEVDIQLGSTAFLQAQPGDTMRVSIIEGQGQVSAGGVTRTVPQGTRVTIPLDANLKATGAPSVVEPYGTGALQGLPVSILPVAVTVAKPLTEKQIADLSVCTVVAAQAVNLGGGPGANYTRIDSLGAGENAQPDGKAAGTDGFTWWRLPSGAWVRSDIVETTGDCTGVPVVADIPPTPTPAPAVTSTQGTDGSTGRSTTFIPLTWCGYSQGGVWPEPVSATFTADMNFGDGNESNIAAILGGGGTFTLSVDGIDQGPPQRVIHESYSSGGCPIGAAGLWTVGPLSPGTHQLVGVNVLSTTLTDIWSCPSGGAQKFTAGPGSVGPPATCTITVK